MSDQPRQQPGLACNECRKKKLRCDRRTPKCGTCLNAGINCRTTTERLPRGPKTGSLKAIQSRLQRIEHQLLGGEQASGSSNDDLVSALGATVTNGQNAAAGGHQSRTRASEDRSQTPESDLEMDQGSIAPPPPSDRTGLKAPATFRATFLDPLTHADLDQLYFDRAHPIVPILNKFRYFAWTEAPAPEGYQLCLQNAMWTLAMSMASRFENVRDMLYKETRQMLDEQELIENDMVTAHLEQAQAWILITFYEFLRESYRRAWMSAGRVFRLVQLLRLHEVDRFQLGSETVEEDEFVKEEKRRTFWVAYCLDRFVSQHNGLPLTLNENIICTRLPAPELGFQSRNLVLGCFLSEAMASADIGPLSPLAECAISVTLFGRAISHLSISTVEQLYMDVNEDFWMRHEWIDAMLIQQIDRFSLNYATSSTSHADPMLLLAHMVLQTTTLYLYKIIDPPASQCNLAKPGIDDYRKRAIAAAQEIARLAKSHAHIGLFKAHVFMPMAIFIAAERLSIQRDGQSPTGQCPNGRDSMKSELKNCVEALQRVQGVNNLAKGCLERLESVCLQRI